MKFLIVLIISAMTVASCSYSNDKYDAAFTVKSNDISIWRDPVSNEQNLILVVEVTNASNKPIHFQQSTFKIMDDTGTVIDVIESSNVYPPVVDKGETAVYYETKVCSIKEDAELNVVPQIVWQAADIDKVHVGVVKLETGGSLYANGTLKNLTTKTNYKDVCVAVVSRNNDGKVISVMTTKIDLVVPREYVEFQVRDQLEHRNLGPDVAVSYENYIYINPNRTKNDD